MSRRAGLLSMCPSKIVPTGNKTCPFIETGPSNSARNNEPLGSFELTSPARMSRARGPSSERVEAAGRSVVGRARPTRCKLISSAWMIWDCGASGSAWSATEKLRFSSVIVCWAEAVTSNMTTNMKASLTLTPVVFKICTAS